MSGWTAAGMGPALSMVAASAYTERNSPAKSHCRSRERWCSAEIRAFAVSHPATVAAQADHLNGLALDLEIKLLGIGLDAGAEFGIVDLDGGAAGLADENVLLHGMAGLAAADEGVQALDPVHAALLDQEVECAIDGRRCHLLPPAAHLRQQVIGAGDRKSTRLNSIP